MNRNPITSIERSWIWWHISAEEEWVQQRETGHRGPRWTEKNHVFRYLGNTEFQRAYQKKTFHFLETNGSFANWVMPSFKQPDSDSGETGAEKKLLRHYFYFYSHFAWDIKGMGTFLAACAAGRLWGKEVEITSIVSSHFLELTQVPLVRNRCVLLCLSRSEMVTILGSFL